jgi:hypothetical protein
MKPPKGNRMSLKSTIDKIKSLETEKRNLQQEIEGLKKIADAKAVALETEVGALREEVKSIKILLSNPAPIAEQMQTNKIKI